jgi:hypothetical protein
MSLGMMASLVLLCHISFMIDSKGGENGQYLNQ